MPGSNVKKKERKKNRSYRRITNISLIAVAHFSPLFLPFACVIIAQATDAAPDYEGLNLRDYTPTSHGRVARALCVNA